MVGARASRAGDSSRAVTAGKRGYGGMTAIAQISGSKIISGQSPISVESGAGDVELADSTAKLTPRSEVRAFAMSERQSELN